MKTYTKCSQRERLWEVNLVKISEAQNLEVHNIMCGGELVENLCRCQRPLRTPFFILFSQWNAVKSRLLAEQKDVFEEKLNLKGPSFLLEESVKGVAPE